MTSYIIAQLRFTDVAAYRRYQRAFPAVFARFKGRLLVADEAPAVKEGEWPFNKVVVMAFPDEDEANRFAQDLEYQTISKDRRLGAETVSIMARGVANLPTPR